MINIKKEFKASGPSINKVLNEAEKQGAIFPLPQRLAKEAAKLGAKTLWLQYGIQNEEAKKISEEANIKYIENKCIKQEYQKLFQKSNPVFPLLKN